MRESRAASAEPACLPRHVRGLARIEKAALVKASLRPLPNSDTASFCFSMHESSLIIHKQQRQTYTHTVEMKQSLPPR